VRDAPLPTLAVRITHVLIRAATMGRPVTIGGDRYIGLRLPADLLSKLDARAKLKGVGRSEFIRMLLADAMQRPLTTRKKEAPRGAVKRGGARALRGSQA
jgi:Ribbon-helix-helix protein, copG family